jgi:hypothetical protein
VLAPEKPYWEKMADFIGYLSEMMAQGKTSEEDAAAFSSSYDLLNDPEIRKFRDAAQEKMTGLLLKLVHEGKAQGHIRPDLSEDAFRFYFAAFSEIFITPQFRQGYYREPKLLHELCFADDSWHEWREAVKALFGAAYPLFLIGTAVGSTISCDLLDNMPGCCLSLARCAC